MSPPPELGVTLGDPRGIGPEVVADALGRDGIRGLARWTVFGPEELTADLPGEVAAVPTGRWPGGATSNGERRRRAGELAARAVEAAVDAAADGRLDGMVTAPLSKEALRASGRDFPGHTELLQARTGAADVTMMMSAETTPLGPPLDGPLRLALATAHLPLRRALETLEPELVVRKARVAREALRTWWGIDRPRLALAGVNPHASEGGLFGDEEARILEPAAAILEEEEPGTVDGIHPADTVFRRCLDGRVDVVVVPYHDVGLAVLKTLALERGVNVTAGLPFPRTSPDHGTAMDIAGTGRADPGSTIQAMRLCAAFARRGAAAASRAGGSAPAGSDGVRR